MAVEKISVQIEGMHCASCKGSIEDRLKKEPGVESAHVNFGTGTGSIEFHTEQIDSSRILQLIQETGYPAFLKDESRDISGKSKNELKKAGWIFLVSALLSLPLFSQMVGEIFFGEMLVPAWVQALLATVIQFYCGKQLYLSTFRSLRAMTFNMDSLIVIGTSAAYGWSLAVWLFSFRESLYFETSGLIITLVLMGKWLEALSRGKASEALEKLLHLQPNNAYVFRDGDWKELPISSMIVGDLFLVRSGEQVPVDGVIVEGISSFDESMLTGESAPVTKKEEDAIFAATISLEGSVQAKAKEVGSKTLLAEMIRLVEEAQESQAPIQRLADLVSSYFVPSVLLISILTLIVSWFFGVSFQVSMMRAVAVLVIACPCALGLATPTVIVVASGLAAENGILFRNAEAIEQAEKIQLLAFDKTGTITKGSPEVRKEIISGDIHAETFLSIAAGIEEKSLHPYALAIVNYAKKKEVDFANIHAFESIPGKGVEAVFEGNTYFVGSLASIRERGGDPSGLEQGKSNQTLVAMAREQEVLGGFILEDSVRPSSKKAVELLRNMHIESVMLTGDRYSVAESIAKEVGIAEFQAEVFPEQKVAFIHQKKGEGKSVGMVGDGINDAPALATATVGFAVGAGSDIALEASDVTIMQNDLLDVVEAIRLSKATMTKARQNLFFAFFYNTLGIPLAALGYLHPILAALAMALSSVSVVTNALLLRFWKPSGKT